jgi:tetratricopeptide (TPR) repeat protein
MTGVALLALFGCKSEPQDTGQLPPGVEALSISGEQLGPPPMAPEERAKKEAELEQARAAYQRHPDDADLLIWFGRRTAYLGGFNEAVRIFTEGIAKHPGDPRMYRHRGHRWITLRQFDRAVADLEQAALLVEGRADEVEPAGIPNARGVPVDTLNQNVFYHLGLARYLRGEFQAAADAYRRCLSWSKNPDALCSVTHWLYMTLQRLGKKGEANALLEPITGDLDVVEYHAYHRLVLAYRGEIDPDRLLEETPPSGETAVDFATIGYGVGNWHLYNGRKERAASIFERVARAEMWPAFGRIAAEVDLARLEPPAPRESPP